MWFITTCAPPVSSNHRRGHNRSPETRWTFSSPVLASVLSRNWATLSSLFRFWMVDKNKHSASIPVTLYLSCGLVPWKAEMIDPQLQDRHLPRAVGVKREQIESKSEPDGQRSNRQISPLGNPPGAVWSWMSGTLAKDNSTALPGADLIDFIFPYLVEVPRPHFHSQPPAPFISHASSPPLFRLALFLPS